MRKVVSAFLAICMIIEASMMVFAQDLNPHCKDEYVITPYGISTYLPLYISVSFQKCQLKYKQHFLEAEVGVCPYRTK